LAGAGFALVGFEFGFLLGEPGFLLFVGAQALGQRTGHRVPLFVFGSENGGQRQTGRPFAGELPIRPVSAERSVPGSREWRYSSGRIGSRECGG
jgi:hypothetical protein